SASRPAMAATCPSGSRRAQPPPAPCRPSSSCTAGPGCGAMSGAGIPTRSSWPRAATPSSSPSSAAASATATRISGPASSSGARQDDVADARKWAQAQGIASSKACIAGGSYGGYSTLMGLIKDPDLYRCGVAWIAVTDLDLYLSGSWWVRDDLPDWGRQYQLPD